MKFILLLLLSCLWLPAWEQVPDTLRQEDVVVKGFETNRPLLFTAAPVFIATQKEMNRYPNTSMVPVVNQSPGVRMEERSPGSYRLSVRGSLLRSPFGVRNIKVYLAGIPFTDAGGNTYINLLDVNMLERIEILKGPAGITYGAGTGGTLLLNEPSANSIAEQGSHFKASLTGGSFNTLGEYLRYQNRNDKNSFSIQQSHLQSDGYRDHSLLRRDALMFRNTFTAGDKNEWNLFLMYGNLHYETPGGITFEQMNQNPKLSRQRAGSIPSAIEQHAGIYQKTFFSGISYRHRFNQNWESNSSLFFAYTDFANPFITNYETRFETSGGGRSVFSYKHGSGRFRLNAGVEASITSSTVTNYGNRAGVKDTMQTKDAINAVQGFAFAQAQVAVTPKLLLDAGLSLNRFIYTYEHIYAVPGEGSRKFDVQWLPRVALLYKLMPKLSVYSSIGRGYSPPAIAEVRPDNQILNTTLHAEAGTNIEAGLRGSFFNGRLFADASAYHFRLNNTIVRRTAASGDYFVNAGNTKQNGIELFVNSILLQNRKMDQIKLFTSVTLNDYTFDHYTLGATVYDGKKITGVPGKIITIGADAMMAKGFYVNATYTYTSSLPLTDDNTVIAQSFSLLGARAGYRAAFKKAGVDLFVAGNNLLDELYSPGNDLNALGKRYYNPGAKRNFSVGLIVKR